MRTGVGVVGGALADLGRAVDGNNGALNPGGSTMVVPDDESSSVQADEVVAPIATKATNPRRRRALVTRSTYEVCRRNRLG